MAPKRDPLSYFSASEDVINDSAVSIPEIISLVYNDVKQRLICQNKMSRRE